jgi:hypothetical protein
MWVNPKSQMSNLNLAYTEDAEKLYVFRGGWNTQIKDISGLFK